MVRDNPDDQTRGPQEQTASQVIQMEEEEEDETLEEEEEEDELHLGEPGQL
jgi:hypothetical protein